MEKNPFPEATVEYLISTANLFLSKSSSNRDLYTLLGGEGPLLKTPEIDRYQENLPL